LSRDSLHRKTEDGDEVGGMRRSSRRGVIEKADNAKGMRRCAGQPLPTNIVL
jgi:hypothetical protein